MIKVLLEDVLQLMEEKMSIKRKKGKKDSIIFYCAVFGIIGIVLIVSGMGIIFKKMSYEKTQGIYTHSTSYTYEDSDGNT